MQLMLRALQDGRRQMKPESLIYLILMSISHLPRFKKRIIHYLDPNCELQPIVVLNSKSFHLDCCDWSLLILIDR